MCIHKQIKNLIFVVVVARDFKQRLFIPYYKFHENFVQCYPSGYLLSNKYVAVVDFTAYVLDLQYLMV